MTDSGEVLLDVDGGVAVVTLNAPDRRNALTPGMAAELIATFDEVDQRADVGALVIKAVGRSFCAGGDIATLTSARVEELKARYALARALQLAAALEQVLAWTVQYAGERVQFGRPLGRFQAIQMELAQMAGEVTAVTALTDAAVQAVERGENVVLACAAAKVRAGAAVEVVARLAHQVHGAIGFTQEHKLHHLTRRLWAWRDEAGSELAWSRVLGAGLLAGGPDDLWPALTRVV